MPNSGTEQFFTGSFLCDAHRASSTSDACFVVAASCEQQVIAIAQRAESLPYAPALPLTLVYLSHVIRYTRPPAAAGSSAFCRDFFLFGVLWKNRM
jgi:hypothetical protein